MRVWHTLAVYSELTTDMNMRLAGLVTGMLAQRSMSQSALNSSKATMLLRYTAEAFTLLPSQRLQPSPITYFIIECTYSSDYLCPYLALSLSRMHCLPHPSCLMCILDPLSHVHP